MAEKITGIELNGKLYSFYSLGMPVYEELGITLERFAELLERDAYCPTLKSEPTSTDLTYTDTDGSVNHFSVGQLCRWEESGSYRFAICRNIADSEVSWYILPTKVSELTNDAGYLTEHQDISGKVDKVSGKGLSTNDYTTTEKNKLAGIAEGANNYSLPTASSTLGGVKTTSTVTSTSGLTATPIISGVPYYKDTTYRNATTSSAGLMSSTDKSKLDGIASGATANVGTITGITMNGASKGTSGVVDLGTVITAHQDISGKVDKVSGKGLSTNDYTTTEKNKLAGIATGAEVNVQSDWNVTDTTSDAYIKNKPTIPSAVSESTVSGWGFTKNAGTITGIKMNGSSKGTSGVVDLGTVITAHQDISGKLDVSTAASTYATKTALSQLQTQIDTLVGGDSASAIESFNEIIAFLEGVEDTETLEGIIAGINAEIAKKADKTAATTSAAGLMSASDKTKLNGIASGAEVNVQSDWSVTDTTSDAYIKNKPTIPSAVSESTVSGWGFTKNAGTITGIKMNGSSKGTSGVVDLGAVITAHQDISGKVDKVDGKGLSTNDYTTTEKNKLAGIAEGANNYSLPTASSSLGGVKTTSNVTSTSGLTATPIINGVPYYKDTTYTSLKNPNALTVQYNGTSSYTYDGSAAKTLNIKAGSNVSVSGDTSGNITINATDTTYTALKNPNSLTLKYNGTTSYSYDGSAAKTLNIKPGSNVSVAGDTSGNITISATDTVYTLPTASSTLGGVKTTSTVTSTSGLTATPIINGVPYYKDTTYTSLKNPNALTVQYNGTSSYTYDGSAAKTLNIKPGSNVSVTGDASGNITIAATNTTYSSMSESEANTGTATTGRVITAQRLHNKINKVLSDGIFVNYAGEYVVDKTYPAGAWVKFGGGDYIAKKSTSLPPIAIAALSSTALALVSTNTYALMGGYEEYGNKDDWFEINPASGSVKRTSASVTLAKGGQKVICSNSSAITVTLPLAPHDGCEIWIAARSGNVTVAPSSGDSLLGGNKTLTSSSGWGVYIYDVQNAQWLFK